MIAGKIMADSKSFERQVLASAVEQTIKLGVGISIDGYMLYSSGFLDIRYGLIYISLLLGYAEDYFLRLSKKSAKKAESLRRNGYTDVRIPVKCLRHGKRGSNVVHTVSFDDFCLIIEHEAEIGNRKALAILTTSFRELLRSRTQAAFDFPEDSLERKQLEFQINYQNYLDDRDDLEALRLPADNLYYPEYQDWEGISPWGISYFEKENLYIDYLK